MTFGRTIVQRYDLILWACYWRWYAELELAIVYGPKSSRYPGGKWA